MISSDQLGFNVVLRNSFTAVNALLWASAQRAGVRHLITEDLQDGFVLQGVMFVNPFRNENDRLIDEILPR